MKASFDKRFHQIFLISLLILKLNVLYSQSVEKCCRFHKIPKSEYQFKLEEYKEELSDLISQKDTFQVSRSMNKIAEFMYCLSYPLDSVYSYLEESYSWDKTAIFTRITLAIETYPRLIAKQRKKNPDLSIADWKYDYREYYLFNLQDSISKPYMAEWTIFRQEEKIKNDSIFTITETITRERPKN